LEILPKHSKLTRLNLATEAGVSRDTPFSRYRSGHEKAGQYRFPQVTTEFFTFRQKKKLKPKDAKYRAEVQSLKIKTAELERLLALSRGVANALDAELDNSAIKVKELETLTSELAAQCEELKMEIMRLRKQKLK
jgi:hypothetical protein